MENTTTPFKTGLRWSLYSSLALTIFISGAILSGWFDFVSSGDRKYYIFLATCFVISIVTLIGALLSFRNKNEGLLTFGEGLSIGIFMGIFTALVIGICIYISSSMMMIDIPPSGDDTSIDEDVAVRMPVALAFGVSIMTFLGFIATSFILSLFLRKE